MRPFVEPLEDRLTPSASIYRTAIDQTGTRPFEVYNTSTNAWTSLNPIDNTGELGVGPDHGLYMVNQATGMLQVYSPGTDTWSNVMATPFAGEEFGNLQVSSSGQFFYWTMGYGGSNPNLYYNTGPGTWSSIALPANALSAGDYDPATNSLYIASFGSTAMFGVNATTHTVTTYNNGSTNVSEQRRFGEVLNGRWYTADYAGYPGFSYDVSNPSAPLQTFTLSPSFDWPAAAADRADALIYLNDYGSAQKFATWNPATNTVTLLPSPPVSLGHTTLAFVPGQATPTVSVSDAGGTYNGGAFPATATVNGSSSLEGVSPTLTYYAGTYTDPSQLAGVTPLGGAPAAAGSYTVLASFLGSADYTAASAQTTFTIAKASPSLSTAAGASVVYGSGVPLTESATLSGPSGMAGTVTFTLHDPSGAVVDTETATVSGPGSYSTPTGYLPPAVGTYQWSASYSGDANDNPAFGNVGLTPTSTLTGLFDIYDVAVDAAGNRYVAESLPNRIAVFAPGSTTPTSFLTGVSTPTWLGFDPAGNLFVASVFSSGLWEFAPGSTTPTATLSGVDHPQGVPTFDAHGDLFISNGGSNTVSEYTPGSTTPTATLTGLNQPADLAFDAAGNLFVCNSSGNTLSEFAPGSTTPTATLTGLNGPQGLAFDANGNLFVSNSGNNTVSEFAPGSTTPTATLTGLSGPGDLASDAAGNLFVLNHSSNTVSEFAPGSTAPTATLSGLNSTIHMTFDGRGDLYVVNSGSASVSEFTPATDPEVVTPATPTVTVSDAGGTYSGGAFPASASVAGVSGVAGSSLEGVGLALTYYSGTYTLATLPSSGSSTAPTAAGSYTVVASFAGSADYAPASTFTTFTIAPAAPSVSVSDPSGSYTGSAFAASATVAGVVPGVDDTPAATLEGVGLTFDYERFNADGSTTDLDTAAPSAPGNYQVTASFDGSADYAPASATTTFTITQAAPALTVTEAGGTYDGGALFAAAVAGVVPGVDDTPAASLEGTGLAVTYYAGTYTTAAQLTGLHGSTTDPAAAGHYTALVSFPGSTDYSAASLLDNFTIAPATPTVSVTDVGGTFSGAAFPASATVAGVVAGVDDTPAATLEGAGLTLDYQQLNAGGHVTADLGSQAPSAAGSYRVTASFAGSADYAPASTSVTFTIAQAAPAVTVVDAGGTFNGSAFPATDTVAGVVAGVDDTPAATLEGVGLVLDYVRLNLDGTTTDLGASAPSAAGSYQVTASFAGSTDYAAASAAATFRVARATTSLGSLSSPTITYGTIATTLSGQLASNTTVPPGSVAITVSGAGLVQPITVTAQVGADGSFSANLPTLSLAAGSYAISYGFAGDGNFTAATGGGTLTVTYSTNLPFDSDRPVKPRGVLKVKLQVTDAGGNNLSSRLLPVRAIGLVGPEGQSVRMKAKGTAHANTLFRYSRRRHRYTFGLDLSGLAAGNYTLYFRVGNDPILHALNFTVK